MKTHTMLVCSVMLVTSLVVGVVFASDFINLGSDANIIVASDSAETMQPDVTMSAISAHDGAKLKAITSFSSNFDVKNLTYEEYITIEAYLNFILAHQLSEDELSEIVSLIANGTPIGTICEAYEFYLTTNDDFSLISQIASYEDSYWGRNWIENAYNDITDDAHGVISTDEYQQYIEKFDVSEILYANVLSRKGIYTINELLDKHSDGALWNELTNEVYSSLLQLNLSGSSNERRQIVSYLNSGIFDYDSAPFEIYNFAFKCAVYGVDFNSVIINSENLYDYKSAVYDKLNESRVDATEKIMSELDLPVTFMSAEEYSEYYDENYNQALDNGFDKIDIELLEKKGFSIGEISAASASVNDGAAPALQHIKSQRGDMLK